MKSLKRILPIVILLLVIFGVIRACGWLDLKEYNFKDYNAFVEAGAKESGVWVPEWLLPRSATDIRERHRVDDPALWVRFKFSSDDRDFIDANCSSVPSSDVTLPGGRVFLWWVKELTGKKKKDFLTLTSGYSFFTCKEESFLAVDKRMNLAYFWKLGAKYNSEK